MSKTLNDKFPKYIELFDGTQTHTTLSPSLYFKGAFSIFIRSILMDSVTNQHKLCPALADISGTTYVTTSLANLFWESMDLYLHMHYGLRTLSPQFENLTYLNPEVTINPSPTDGAKFIGYNILSIYGNKWDMLISSSGILQYITDEYKYAPLENYDRYEEIDQYRQNTGDQKQEYNHYTQETGKVKTTPSGSYKDTVDGSGAYPTNDASGNGSTSQRKIKGFNSTGLEVVEESNTKAQIHQTTERSHTNYNETVEYGADSSDRKTIVKSDTGAGDKRTDNLTEHVYTDPQGSGNHIHGNIGVTTAVQMMNGIIQHKSMTLVYDIICKDLADYLCLPIY